MSMPDVQARRGWLIASLTVAAFLFLVAFAATQASASSHHGIEQDHRIGLHNTNPDKPYEAFDAVTLAAVDLTGDGVKEIVTHNDNNRAYVFDGTNGNLLAELTTNHPDGWHARELAGPAIGDLSGNGLKDIVLTNSAGWVTAFEAQPTSDHRKIDMVRTWETFLDPNEQDPNRDWDYPGMDGPAFLADTNNDGRDEVFAQLDDQPSHYKLNPDGHVEAWTDYGDGNAGPLAGDLDGDGSIEAVYPSDGGQVIIYEGDSMQHRCTFNARDFGTWPASISVSPTLADVTNDGNLEIVFGARNVQEEQYEGWEDDSDAHYFAVNAWCDLIWHKTWTWSNPHVHMHPVPFDVDGDGDLDVIFQDWNTVGHKPGNWQHTGPSNLFAVEGHTGNLLWRAELPNYWSNKNVAVTDATGDGQIEVVANEVDQGDGISLYTPWGEKKGFVSAPNGWVVTKGPIFVDLDGDDQLEMILPVHRDADFCETERDVGCREGALQIYSTPSHADPIYPNNHMLNADDAAAQPPDDGDGGDDPDDGEFDAEFIEPRGNDWWVEVDVNANDPLQGVHARVNAGDWRALEEQDWGSWAKSFHVPDGSIVQFQARNHDGDTALSGCYEWPDANPTECPGDGDNTGDGEFDADFVNPRGNEWWVETDVQSERHITGVDARIDGGSWTALEQQDWGSWAKSIHAPEGSIVQFQAHTDDGSRALSACYEWTHASQTSCPDGSDGGDDGDGDFDAEYIEPRGNEWWVETDVEANQPVVAVDARVDGGSWFALERTDWGSWAKDTHVGEDVDVEFRATSDSGQTDISDVYRWPPD